MQTKLWVKFIACIKKEKSHISNLIFHVKKLEKRSQLNQSKQTEQIIKIKMMRNEIEDRKTIERIN